MLRERKFARVDVQAIDWSKRQKNINLDSILIKDSHRKMTKVAVSSHFKAQEEERRAASPHLIWT